MSPSLSKSQKKLFTMFGSIFIVILILMFLNPIRNDRVAVEETDQYNLSEGTYANYRIRFQQGEKVSVNFTVEAWVDDNETFREIDILFLDESNFDMYSDGDQPKDMIEEGSSLNTSSFSADFQLTEQGVYYLVLDNTNMFTLADKNPMSFSKDRAKVSLDIRIEKTKSIIGIPEMIEGRSQAIYREKI